MRVLDAVGHALNLAFSMTWEVTWALILGFFLSAAVQALVSKQAIVRLLGDDRPRTLATATGLGAASSSCSYAAVVAARSLVRKGASFTAAMAFEIASTNLVIELGIILALLIGWRFTLGEFVGGPVMIVVLAVLFRRFLRTRVVDEARRQADRGVAGSMEGHAAMDMSVPAEGSLWRRLTSPRGFTAVSHIFVMELGRGTARYHRWPAHRGRGRRMGARQLLAAVLSHRPPAAREDLGTAGRPAGRGGQLRLLDW